MADRYTERDTKTTMKIECWLCGEMIEENLEGEHFVDVHNAKPDDMEKLN